MHKDRGFTSSRSQRGISSGRQETSLPEIPRCIGDDVQVADSQPLWETRILDLAKQLGNCLKQHKMTCAVAESCTGGQLAAAITEIAGSSEWFDRGFITYSNQAKIDMLAVPADILISAGAVSEMTVRAMARGALLTSGVDLTVAISGIAGPSGGSEEKPVGLVWLGWAKRAGEIEAASYYFSGNRNAIRLQAVIKALQGLIERCSNTGA
jgi:nicotinamide-nucleotide amidase